MPPPTYHQITRIWSATTFDSCRPLRAGGGDPGWTRAVRVRKGRRNEDLEENLSWTVQRVWSGADAKHNQPRPLHIHQVVQYHLYRPSLTFRIGRRYGITCTAPQLPHLQAVRDHRYRPDRPRCMRRPRWLCSRHHCGQQHLLVSHRHTPL